MYLRFHSSRSPPYHRSFISTCPKTGPDIAPLILPSYAPRQTPNRPGLFRRLILLLENKKPKCKRDGECLGPVIQLLRYCSMSTLKLFLSKCCLTRRIHIWTQNLFRRSRETLKEYPRESQHQLTTNWNGEMGWLAVCAVCRFFKFHWVHLPRGSESNVLAKHWRRCRLDTASLGSYSHIG